MAAAAAGGEGSSSVAGRVVNSQVTGVRCVLHNFPDDDDDAESTIRSLFEPDLIVRHCQPSTTGLSDFSHAWPASADVFSLLWSPYVIGHTIIFLPCGFFFFLFSFLA